MCKEDLTSKQEAFLQGLMEGKSQRQAYISAYPKAEKWIPETVDSRASNLLKNNKVFARYQELQAEAREAGKVSREDILAEVSKLAFIDIDINALKETDILKAKLKAQELLIKLLGYDQSKMDVTVNEKPKVTITFPDDGHGGYE